MAIFQNADCPEIGHFPSRTFNLIFFFKFFLPRFLFFSLFIYVFGQGTFDSKLVSRDLILLELITLTWQVKCIKYKSGFSLVWQDLSGKFECPVLSGQGTHMPGPVEPYKIEIPLTFWTRIADDPDYQTLKLFFVISGKLVAT